MQSGLKPATKWPMLVLMNYLKVIKFLNFSSSKCTAVYRNV